MKKTGQTLWILIKRSYGLILIGFLSILVTVALTDLVFHLTDRVNPVRRVRIVDRTL